jgi:hypothetical protein
MAAEPARRRRDRYALIDDLLRTVGIVMFIAGLIELVTRPFPPPGSAGFLLVGGIAVMAAGALLGRRRG